MSALKSWSLGAALLCAGLATAAYAQRGRCIAVTRARGTFRAIRLRVEAAPVEFDRVVVHFGNGSSERLVIRAVIPAGGETRAIDLPGNRRVIRLFGMM